MVDSHPAGNQRSRQSSGDLETSISKRYTQRYTYQSVYKHSFSTLEIPDFPIQKTDTNEVVLDQSHIGHCDPLPSNAPSFAPPLPSRQTYSTHKRPVVDRKQDSKRTRLTLLEQKNRVQQSLHGLHVAFESTRLSDEARILPIYA